ncbi:MAG: right-handed parallel beta-helix repeat-containing protein [Planctomycetia bacterium]|nr:right-handed parallel beta-helix repeat-containing protein [Planctomycetia bacterium]
MSNPRQFKVALPLLFLVLLAFASGAIITSAVLATEYYVDSLEGDDAQDGLTPQSAWLTLARVNRACLSPGDAVLFRSGRLWRGRLVTHSGEEGAPIRYGSYGQGEAPRIVNSVDLTSERFWTDLGDNIWSTPADYYEDVDASYDELPQFAQGLWHVYCEKPASATCVQQRFDEYDQEVGYRVDCANAGESGSHLQVTVQSFPVRADRYIALRFRARASSEFTLGSDVARVIMTGAPWSSYADTLQAPETITTQWQTYDLVFHTKVDAEDGRLTFFLGANLPSGVTFDFIPLQARELKLHSSGLTADVGNLVFTENNSAFQASEEIVNPAVKVFAPTWSHAERPGFKRWTRDDLHQQGDFWFDLRTKSLYLYSEANPSEQYVSIEAPLREHCCLINGHDVILENLALTHTAAHGVSIQNGERVVIRNCFFDWIGGGDLASQGGAGRRVRFGNGVEFWNGAKDCTVERCRFTRVYDVATTTQGPAKTSVRNLFIRDCVMWRCEQSFEIWFDHPETTVENLVFERNLCIESGREWSHQQRPNKIATPILGYQLLAKTVDITIRENVFYDTAQFFFKSWHNRIGEYHVDQNVYWIEPENENRPYENGDKRFVYNASQGAIELDWQRWRETTGHDMHSHIAKPQFRDYQHDDFYLLNRADLQAGPVQE